MLDGCDYWRPTLEPREKIGPWPSRRVAPGFRAQGRPFMHDRGADDPPPQRSSGSSDSPAVDHVRGVIHGSFTVVRRLAAPPGRVFAAFSDFSLRKRWFRIPTEPGTGHHELDFRVGGREIARGTFAPSGVPERIEYRSQFLDIVLDQRIVFMYELLLDGRLRSVSLVTVELAPGADGPRSPLRARTGALDGPRVTAWCGSAGTPCRCENGALRATPAAGGQPWAETVCRRPRWWARQTAGARRRVGR
jgi:uncharacterized protein YndB with AHSA1/START domain